MCKVILNNKEYRFERINNDTYGNPRYIIHYSNLGLNSNESTKKTRSAGLSKYRKIGFENYFIVQSYNLEMDLKFILEKLDLN